MKLIFILALSASASAQTFDWFCNGGTGGNGGCEANGQATYCCFEENNVPGFNTPRPTTTTSQNAQGGIRCGPNNGGLIRCGPR
ncbi:hypothetical protein HYALB_00008675 [Hymenoscyphus albidus]|uniref:Hydrophobin n=1 Tax=Hymenoscyphus albidus TaxID=595503 RepID=A0A9N9LDD0_9HELO|nr:hypothetical protein HYALB_00008675 [Hymenoscyphus albidus]